MKKYLTTLIPLLALGLQIPLSSCSSGSSSSPLSETPTTLDSSFADKVTGPTVEGSWTSACTAYFEAYRILKISFQGRNVTRSSAEYTDQSCTQPTKNSQLKGVFRWSGNTSYGGYSIDYRFDLGKGVTQITQEEILLDSNKLYLSDFASGFGSIDKSTPLTKDGASSAPTGGSTPSADPNVTKGRPAQSLQSAKFAFCTIQGNAVLLDFKGQDLSRVTQGALSSFVRPCNSAQAFAPLTSAQFTVQSSGRVVITLTSGIDGSMQQGYRGLADMSSEIDDNSGYCTLLENKGVAGVFGEAYGSMECE